MKMTSVSAELVSGSTSLLLDPKPYLLCFKVLKIFNLFQSEEHFSELPLPLKNANPILVKR